MKNKDRLKVYQKGLVVIGCIFFSFFAVALFLLYGPISYFREILITTAMTTQHHQYLAKWFYSDQMIDRVLEKHQIVPVNEVSDPSYIHIDDDIDLDDVLFAQKGDDDLFRLIPVCGTGYQGFLVAVYDPSKVHLALTKHLYDEGEDILSVVKDNQARVAINAGGFTDSNQMGNGASPIGIVIQDGQVIQDTNESGDLIGFTADHKLLLGKMTSSEALSYGIKDAVEFGPFLIINGKPSFVIGNGGWGIAPRTAIGQRQDGVVLFLVINGRIPSSIGADMLDLVKIMQKYGAYNAANLDGGSSTALVIDGKIINHPVASGKNGLRNMATFWIVKN